MRRTATAAALLALLIAAGFLPYAAGGARALFLLLVAIPGGAILLLCVARLTGATWGEPLEPIARAMPLAVLPFAPVIAGQAMTSAPPHLALWLHPLAFAARGAVAILAWAWVGRRLADGAGETFAAVALAAFGFAAIPLAHDWLLGQEPGRPDSAAPMLLAVQFVGAAAATLLVMGGGTARDRRDLAALLVASALGVAYLLFVDYFIVWYGNLPERVPAYLARGGPAEAVLALAALVLGLLAPIALLARGMSRTGGAAALAGLGLALLWQVGPSPGGLILLLAALGTLAAFVGRGRRVDERG